MNDEAVNMVSAHHHNDTLAGDRSQFFASVYASAPGRLVIPSAIITDHSAGSAGSEGSMSVQGTAAVEGRVASTSGMGLNAEQTTGMIHPPRCCEVPQAAFPSVTKGGGVTCGRSSERSATQTCRTTSSKSFQEHELRDLLEVVNHTSLEDSPGYKLPAEAYFRREELATVPSNSMETIGDGNSDGNNAKSNIMGNASGCAMDGGVMPAPASYVAEETETMLEERKGDGLGFSERFSEEERSEPEELSPQGVEQGVSGDDPCSEIAGVHFGGSAASVCVEEVEGGDGAAASPPNVDYKEEHDCCGASEPFVTAAAPPQGPAPSAPAPTAPGSLTQVVLKFTTVPDDGDAPSFFTVGREGATVGRGPGNDICIPSDACMGESDHASIVWQDGAFHVQDRGYRYGASVRIGKGTGLREWPLRVGSVFSAGNSVFQIRKIDEEDGMLLEIVAGPLKGQKRRVHRGGATVGRATENTISIADRELSRHHSRLECQEGSMYISGGSSVTGASDDDGEERLSKRHVEYFLCDVGSTNGTFVQLVGPYASSRRLELSDRILIGRTGFSINRFDWGAWEDRGSRRAMEDKSVVIQDMGVESLTALGLGPQTFLAVYDGHGGSEASEFLWEHLHVAITEALEEAGPQIAAALQEDREAARKEAAVAMTRSTAPPISSPLSIYDGDGVSASGQSAIARGGGGGEAMRCADRDGEKGHNGGRAGGGDPMSAMFASEGTGLMLPLPQAPPTVASVAPPTLSGGISGARHGDGTVVAWAQDTEGSEEDIGLESGGAVVPERADCGRSDSGCGDGECGGASKWRWGREQPTAVVSPGAAALGHRVAIAYERQQQYSAPSLPQEWLLGARASMAYGGGGGEGKASSRSAPPLPSCWVEEKWDFDGSGGDDTQVVAAGGDAANGVRTEVDGAGGQQGGGNRADSESAATDHSGSSAERSAPGGDACSTSDYCGPAKSMVYGIGRESPPPPSGGRSGAQSPGGEPSRSLATAGLPAEGAGGAAHRWQLGNKGVVQQPQTTAVDRVVNDAVSRAFLATDEEFLQTSSKPTCGSTATTVMILGDRFYSFNLGDSRTVLCRSGRVGVVSKDHKPNRADEMERIKKAGGMVIAKRVMGELAVSRAFGDRSFKIGIKNILKEEEAAQQLEQERAEQEEAELAAELLELQRESAADEFEKQDTESDDSDDELSVQEHQEEQNTLTMGRGIMPSTSARDILLKSATSSTKRLLLSRTDSSNTDVGGSASSLSSSSKVQAPPAPPASLPSAPPQPLPTAHATAAGPCAPQDLPPQPPIGGANDVVPKRVAVTDPKDALITAQPEMLACTLTAEDEFVLLACDGLFDVFSSEEVVSIVREEMSKHGDTQRACETLTRKAIDERYTRDNVSIVLVVLRKFW